jgi:hypothetical protein
MQGGSGIGNNNISTASQASASGTTASLQENGRATNGSTKADFWKQVEQRRSTTPAATEEMDIISQAMQPDVDQEREGELEVKEEDDDDFLAPSPVKPSAVAKLKVKGKQRQHLDLFSEGFVDISSTGPTNGQSKNPRHLSNTQPSTSKVPSATPITSFFTAKPRSTLLPESTEGSSSVKRPYVPGPSKPKKRTIAATSALIPNISEDFDKIEDMDIAPIATSTASTAENNKKNGKWTKSATNVTAKFSSKGKQKEEDHLQDSQERVKRPRKEVNKPTMSAEEEAMLEQERAQRNQNDDGDEMYTFTEEMPVDDDYETRDLSDEYESYKPSRKRSITPAVLATGREQSASVSASTNAPLDESLDPELVSLLSLRASPVKNRLSKLHKKQDETYRKILLEPTYVMESKRQIRGLEDLEDEEKRKQGEGKDDDQEDWDADEDHVNQNGLETEVHSDDDWASEPEGWKDLSDGEMPEDPF